MGISIAIGALIVAGISTAASVDQQRAASRDANRARKAQRRAEKVRAARARKKTLADARRARAESISQQGASGVSSSASLGQQGSIQSQLASNISFLNSLDTLSERAFQAESSAARHQSNAFTADAVTGAALQVAGKAGN